jgi:hypothetical protein
MPTSRKILIVALAITTLFVSAAEFAARTVHGEIAPDIDIEVVAAKASHGQIVCVRHNYKNEWIPERKESLPDRILYKINSKYPTSVGLLITSGEAKKAIQQVTVTICHKEKSDRRIWRFSKDQIRTWKPIEPKSDIFPLPDQIRYSNSFFESGKKIMNWPGDREILILALKCLAYGFFSLPVMGLIFFMVLFPFSVASIRQKQYFDSGSSSRCFKISIALIVIIDLLYSAVVFSKNSFDAGSLFFFVYVIHAIIRDTGFFLLVAALFPERISRIASSIFMGLFIFLSFVNTGFYFYGFIKFQRIFLNQITAEGIRSFLEPLNIILSAVIISLIAFAIYNAGKTRIARRMNTLILSFVMIAIVIIDYPSRTMNFIALTKTTQSPSTGKNSRSLQRELSTTRSAMFSSISPTNSFSAEEKRTSRKSIRR